MTSLPLPMPITNTDKLADWLEVSAILSTDRNSSKGDLERALATATVFSHRSRSLEPKLVDVFAELDRREVGSGDAYPFSIAAGVVELKDSIDQYPAYVFCLCLSYFGWKAKADAPINPWLLFEELSCLAAAEYIGGEVFHFGTGKRSKKSTFKTAVDAFCTEAKEGGGFGASKLLSTKDDNVDLIAWKRFRDDIPSKLMMFGQCAAGDGWKDKDGSLQPEKFWSYWISGPQVSPFVRSFYIPHRIVDIDDWEHRAGRAGVLFDRCRIADLATANRPDLHKDGRFIQWSKSVLLTSPPKRAAAKAAPLRVGKVESATARTRS